MTTKRNPKRRENTGGKWHKRPRGGKKFAEYHGRTLKIEKLEKQAAYYKSRMEGKQIVTYEGVDHEFQPFWTNAPRAADRDKPDTPRNA